MTPEEGQGSPGRAPMMNVAGTKWIEFVRVRSSPHALQDAFEELESSVDALGDACETYLLQHALYDGDLAVVVVWHDERPPARSREGLLLAAQLERLGSVEHAVWRPRQPTP